MWYHYGCEHVVGDLFVTKKQEHPTGICYISVLASICLMKLPVAVIKARVSYLEVLGRKNWTRELYDQLSTLKYLLRTV